MQKISCFGGLDAAYTGFGKAAIAVLPVPYDKTSTWIKGADKGPFALIEASYAVELYDIDTDFEVYKEGIHTCPSISEGSTPEHMITSVEKKVKELIDAGKFVVTLGGEHSISLGPIKAYRSRIKDLSVLQLDAHADLRDEYEGSPFNHACIMARVKELCPIVQAGIRSMSYEEKAVAGPEKMFFAKDIMMKYGWEDGVIDRLSENVYVTIDLDVFDPSIMPSTGTPEPGGLGWYQVTELLRKLSSKRNVVGFDVVELCPSKANKSPDFVAAKLTYGFLSWIFHERKKSKKQSEGK